MNSAYLPERRPSISGAEMTETLTTDGLVRRLLVAADGIEKVDLGRRSMRRGYEQILREAADALRQTDTRIEGGGEMEVLARRLRDYRPPALDPAHGREYHPICDEAADALTSATTRIQSQANQIAALMTERKSLIATKREQIERLTNRATNAEAKLADAVKVLKRLKGVVTYPCDTSIQARGYGTRSIDISGCEYIAEAVDTFLSTIGEKPGAE